MFGLVNIPLFRTKANHTTEAANCNFGMKRGNHCQNLVTQNLHKVFARHLAHLYEGQDEELVTIK